MDTFVSKSDQGTRSYNVSLTVHGLHLGVVLLCIVTFLVILIGMSFYQGKFTKYIQHFVAERIVTRNRLARERANQEEQAQVPAPAREMKDDEDFYIQPSPIPNKKRIQVNNKVPYQSKMFDSSNESLDAQKTQEHRKRKK